MNFIEIVMIWSESLKNGKEAFQHSFIKGAKVTCEIILEPCYEDSNFFIKKKWIAHCNILGFKIHATEFIGFCKLRIVK